MIETPLAAVLVSIVFGIVAIAIKAIPKRNGNADLARISNEIHNMAMRISDNHKNIDKLRDSIMKLNENVLKALS